MVPRAAFRRSRITVPKRRGRAKTQHSATGAPWVAGGLARDIIKSCSKLSGLFPVIEQHEGHGYVGGNWRVAAGDGREQGGDEAACVVRPPYRVEVVLPQIVSVRFWFVF